MSDIIDVRAMDVKVDEKQRAVVKEEIILPKLNDPTFFYKKDTKMFWLGIPTDKTDVFTACCILDSMKLQYVDVVKSIIQELQAKKDAIIPASTFNQMRKNFVAKFNK